MLHTRCVCGTAASLLAVVIVVVNGLNWLKAQIDGGSDTFNLLVATSKRIACVGAHESGH